jgi:hypothetical protein
MPRPGLLIAVAMAVALSGCIPGLWPPASPNTDAWSAVIDNQTSRTIVVTGEAGGRQYPVATIPAGHDASVEFILSTSEGCSTYVLTATDPESDAVVATREPMCTGDIWTIDE